MRVKSNIVVLDTETIGVMTCPLLHNAGWHMVDKSGDTTCERDFRVSEFHYQQPELLETSDFYIAHRISQDNACRRFKNVVHQLAEDERANKIKTMAAYNLAFDYRAIKATAKFFGLENDRDVKYVLAKNMLDIWKLAKDTVCKEAGYAQYIDSCDDGYTAIGNMKTDAEHVYRYLVGDGNFHEAHTALADCRIEAYILSYILKHYKGVAQYYIPKDRKVKE